MRYACVLKYVMLKRSVKSVHRSVPAPPTPLLVLTDAWCGRREHVSPRAGHMRGVYADIEKNENTTR